MSTLYVTTHRFAQQVMLFRIIEQSLAAFLHFKEAQSTIQHIQGYTTGCNIIKIRGHLRITAEHNQWRTFYKRLAIIRIFVVSKKNYFKGLSAHFCSWAVGYNSNIFPNETGCLSRAHTLCGIFFLSWAWILQCNRRRSLCHSDSKQQLTALSAGPIIYE